MKRRLQLMPEVLPAPNKTATSAVRERTMARLRVLAAVGAGIAAACGGATRTGSETGDGNGGGGPDGGLPDGNKPDSDPGYGVVDPLPPPACFDYATPPQATASVVTVQDAGVDASGDPSSGNQPRYARVIVTLNQKDVAVGEVTIVDGEVAIIEKELKAGEVELVLRQPPQASYRPFQTTVDIQTSCAKGPTRVTVTINELVSGALSTQVSFYGG
jgi:hypothetical protein